MTLFQKHCARWGKGCSRETCAAAKHIVLCRGTLPCQVLFVGEAPGESEDVCGLPFVGPAGRLMDQIIARGLDAGITYALTNVVACIPREEEGQKATEPGFDEMKECSPRLLDLIAIASPSLIVCVGVIARDWLDTKVYPSVWQPTGRSTLSTNIKSPWQQIPQVEITHPAAIIRANIAQRAMAIQRCAVILREAVETHIGA